MGGFFSLFFVSFRGGVGRTLVGCFGEFLLRMIAVNLVIRVKIGLDSDIFLFSEG